MLPFRIWELSLGGLIGLFPKEKIKNRNYNYYLPLLGLIFIFISYLFAARSITYITVLPVFGAVLIIFFSDGKDIVGKLLSHKTFVHIGKSSYSLYLWHWPVIVLFNNIQLKLIGVSKVYIYILIIFITYVLSYLSYKLIETKLRYHGKTLHFVLFGLVLCFTLTTFYKSSYFNIHYKPLYNQQNYTIRYYDVSPLQAGPKKDNPITYNTIMPERLVKHTDAYKKSGILTIINNNEPKVLIMGDSHGVMWVKTLLDISKELQLSTSVYTTNGVKPFFNIKNLNEQEENKYFTKRQRIDYAKSICSNIEKWKIKTIILSCRWEDLSIGDKINLQEFIDYLNGRNVNIILINQPPRISFMNDLNAVQYISYLNLKPKKGFNVVTVQQKEVIRGNEYVNFLKKKHSNIMIFDVFGMLYKDGAAKITHDKEVLYFDDDHLSYSGTKLYKDDLKQILKISLQ